jgi:hypothetical protein
MKDNPFTVQEQVIIVCHHKDTGIISKTPGFLFSNGTSFIFCYGCSKNKELQKYFLLLKADGAWLKEGSLENLYSYLDSNSV